jgi:hypothetical protein
MKMPSYVYPESQTYFGIYKGPCFLAVLWFGSSPTRHPPLPSLPSVSTTNRKIEKERQLSDKGQGGMGKSQNVRRQESLVLYNSLNILCVNPLCLRKQSTSSTLSAGSIECFIEDQAFLRWYNSGLRSPPAPLFHQQFVSLFLSLYVSPVKLTDGRVGEGLGEQLNHTNERKPGYSILILCSSVSVPHALFY